MEPKRPKNEQAENMAFGAALQERFAVGYLLERCTESHFDVPKNRIIFKAIESVYNGGGDVDVMSVYNELARLKSSVGAEYLMQLTDRVPSAQQIYTSVQGLEDAYVFRSIHELSHTLNKEAKSLTSKPDDVLEKAQTKIFELLSGYVKSDLVPISTGSEKYMEMAEWAHDNPGKIRGIETKYSTLDRSLNGLLPQRLTVLAARPSMGKSALAVCIALHVAQQGIPVAFFSLEMSLLQIQERLIGVDKKINTESVRSGRITDKEFAKIGDSLSKFGNLPLYVDDADGQTVEDIRAKTRRAVGNYGIKLVIVDHMHIVRAKARQFSRNDQLGFISSNLKGTAKENDIHVLSLAQLNRSVEARSGADKVPQNSDLRESGNIEQDADNVMFLHRWEYYQQNLLEADRIIPNSGGISSINKALLRIAKARDNRAPVDILLNWTPEFTKFSEIDTVHSEPEQTEMPIQEQDDPF